MSIPLFIKNKSTQLTHYVEAYWADRIVYRELQSFLWDTLEEWTLQDNQQFEVYTHQERVFWHIIFCLQHTEETSLLNDVSIKKELSFLMKYLHNDELCPLEVVGIRP